MPKRTQSGFTLIELLVVIAILTLLTSILLPALGRARMLTRIAIAHSELRGVTVGMEMYRQENNEAIPPTRFSCSSRTAYQLPVELAPYLPAGRSDGLDIIDMPDPFTPGAFYMYRAVGTAILNESTLVENASTLWIADGFPSNEKGTGRYYSDPSSSPVLYAVWSMGPEPDSPKFDIPGRLPVPRQYWLNGASDTGVIVHFEDNRRRVRKSP